jgi:hypothetical protein
VTLIDWYTLPRNGNGGACIVRWRMSTNDTYNTSFRDYSNRQANALSYLVGASPPHYPVPAIPMQIDFSLCQYGIGPKMIETYRNTFDDEPLHASINHPGNHLELLYW